MDKYVNILKTEPPRSEFVVQECIHHAVERQAHKTSTATAIEAWDGNLTYSELNELAIRLAGELLVEGVGPGMIVGLIFDKSMIAVVSMLAVLKAGGACVILDPMQQMWQLESIVSQSEVALIISSKTYEKMVEKLCPDILTVDQSMLDDLTFDSQDLPGVSPTCPAYAIFTYSSEYPKGVLIEHASFSRGIEAYGTELGVGPGIRIFQYAPFASPVSFIEIFTSLSKGACICIPSERECIDDPAGAICRFKANWASLAPSAIRKIHPDQVPCLQKLTLSEEPISQQIIDQWAENIDLRVVFRFAAGSTHCCVTPSIHWNHNPLDIGFPVGCQIRIIDPDDSNTLLPKGRVGYIAVEGKLFAREYLGDATSSKEKLLDYDQRLDNYSDSTNRPQLYKTGILASLNPDGSLKLVKQEYMPSNEERRKSDLILVKDHTEIPSPSTSNRSSSPSTSYTSLDSPEGENTLFELCSRVLGIKIHHITPDSNFIRLGGDSAAAVRLASAVEAEGWELSFKTILNSPSLAQMTLEMRWNGKLEDLQKPEPFSMISSERYSNLISRCAMLCSSLPAEIEDVYPATTQQGNSFAVSIRNKSNFVSTYVQEITNQLSISRMKLAWEAVYQDLEILRTRLVYLTDNNGVLIPLQVVLHEKPEWEEHTCIEDAHRAFGNIGNGNPLSRLSIIKPHNGKYNLQIVWMIHEALVDTFSSNLIFDQLSAIYQGFPLQKMEPFKIHLSHLTSIGYETASNWWKSYLKDATIMDWPSIRSQGSQVNTSQHEMPLKALRSHDYTIASYLNAAWAHVISTFSNSKDIIFGAMISGRAKKMHNILSVVGPIESILPFRVIIRENSTLGGLLAMVQQHITNISEQDHLSLADIKQLDINANTACRFQTVLVTRPRGTRSKLDLLTPMSNQIVNVQASEYPIVLQCQELDNGIHMTLNYQSDAFSPFQAETILDHMAHTVERFLSQPLNSLLSEILIQDPGRYEKALPLATTEPTWPSEQFCIHEKFRQVALQQPSLPAIVSWDAQWDYETLNIFSSTTAYILKDLGVKEGSIVPICAPKSSWVIAAILAVLKAGGTFVLLDSVNQPEKLQSKVRLTNFEIILVAPETAHVFSGVAKHIVDITKICKKYQCPDENGLPDPAPNAVAYLTFVGSEQDGAYVEIKHHTHCADLSMRASLINRNIDSRVFQYSSFNADTSIEDILTTLLLGGCVCSPRNMGPKEDLWESFTRLGANTLSVSSNILGKLDPEAFPALETLIITGENPGIYVLQKWVAKKVKIINSYGYPEGATFITATKSLSQDYDTRNIGELACGKAWIVSPENKNKLLPRGATGELLVEGPCLAQSYYNDKARFERNFIKNLPWALPGQLFFRTGDLARFSEHDNSIILVTPRASRVKHDSQTTSLIEIARHVKDIIRVPDCVVKPLCFGNLPSVVISFICFENLDTDTTLVPLTNVLISRIRTAQRELTNRVPHYMVPTVFIPVSSIPVTTDGRVDHHTLDTIAHSLSPAQLLRYKFRQQDLNLTFLSDTKHILIGNTWASVLNIKLADLRIDSNFFSLGGDSLSALRLSTLAKEVGFLLRTEDVFENPELYRMASFLNEASSSTTIKDLSINDANNELESQGFWGKYLSGSTSSEIFSNSGVAAVTGPKTQETVRHSFQLAPAVSDNMLPMIACASYALVLSLYSESLDVTYGLMTRDNLHSSSPIPFRVQVDLSKTYNNFVNEVKHSLIQVLTHRHIGLQSIRSINTATAEASKFDTNFSVELESDDFSNYDLSTIKTDNSDQNILFIQCQLGRQGQVTTEAIFDTAIFSKRKASQFLSQFELMMSQLGTLSSNTLLRNLQLIMPEEDALIRSWNSWHPEGSAARLCIHELVEETVDRKRHLPAIEAWDGSASYGQLDVLATKLAKHLIHRGIGSGAKIPICFDKSFWTPVAMLACLKAGAAYVPLDPTHPTERLHVIVNFVSSDVILVGESQFERFRGIVPDVLVVERNMMDNLPNSRETLSRRASPGDTAIVVFTSGSTGLPKGVELSHTSFCTLAAEVGDPMDLTKIEPLRVLQFAAYAFDVSNAETFLTFIFGGTLCIVDDDEKFNDLAGAINRLSINWLYLTPTATTLLKPEQVPGLKTLILGGEAGSNEIVATWAPHVHLVNSFGPAEGGIWPSFSHLTPSSSYLNIGRSAETRLWIVHPENHDQLMGPIGATGELLLEGPMLASGYLREPGKTAAAFIQPPSWAKSMGATGVFYKTGDLVRYNEDGSQSYVARKDGQVKLRGQRLDLGEVEYATNRCLECPVNVAAEIVYFADRPDAMLAVFLCSETLFPEDGKNETEHVALTGVTTGLKEKLETMLPSYMVPSVFIPLRKLPLTMSGKRDRKTLKEGASKVKYVELVSGEEKLHLHTARNTEAQLSEIWAKIM